MSAGGGDAPAAAQGMAPGHCAAHATVRPRFAVGGGGSGPCLRAHARCDRPASLGESVFALSCMALDLISGGRRPACSPPGQTTGPAYLTAHANLGRPGPRQVRAGPAHPNVPTPSRQANKSQPAIARRKASPINPTSPGRRFSKRTHGHGSPPRVRPTTPPLAGPASPALPRPQSQNPEVKSNPARASREPPPRPISSHARVHRSRPT